MSLPATAQPCTFILTADRLRSLPFYTGVLGLALLAEDDFAATLDTGNGTPLRLTGHAGWVAQPHTVLGWNVTDIRAAMTALIARGVKFEIYEGFGQDADGVWSGAGAHVAWFADPDGNILSLTQFGELDTGSAADRRAASPQSWFTRRREDVVLAAKPHFPVGPAFRRIVSQNKRPAVR